MNEAKATDNEPLPGSSSDPIVARGHGHTTRAHLWAAAGYVGLLLALFAKPLMALVSLAADSELHSYVLLVPFISAYLLYLRREKLPVPHNPAWGLAILSLAAGAVAATVAVAQRTDPPAVSYNDHLSLMALSFVCFVIAGGFLLQGRAWMKAATFPIAFLIFMVPLPDALANSLETASKLASAEAASLFFQVTDTPVVRNGNIFELPNIVIEVAEECSGIRSSIVLFITSLLASHLFLMSPWRRAILVALVIPLGILRNGFRIVAIGLLCVRYGPQMIHSVIHTRGGPLFFAASLIPLFLLLWWLRRGEAPRVNK
jgi:exosortase C (VPDSG-CTERM-specific)